MTKEDNTNPSKAWVEDLTVGQNVRSVFQITRMALRDYERGKFLTLRLGDKTGKISAVMWDSAEEAYKMVKEGDIVQVSGRVGSYNNEKQVSIADIRLIDKSSVNPFDFLPASAIPVEVLTQKFDQLLEGVQDPDLKSLLRLFRNDETLWKKFSVAPAAKRWHHPHLHGLLEHTLFVTRLCQLIAPMYPEVNQDILVAGAIFHDCGKIDELIYETHFDYSTKGRLVGHTFIGLLILERLISQLSEFPAEKKLHLQHILLSHHGDVERSPILPMTLEANLFHFIDNMDSKMAGLTRELKKAKTEGNSWTEYIQLMNRYLYLGENHFNDENNE